MSNHALRFPPGVPPDLTMSTWGILWDLLAVDLQPKAPRLAARLVELGLVVVARHSRRVRGTREVVVPIFALTDEGRRVAELAPRSITGRRSGRCAS